MLLLPILLPLIGGIFVFHQKTEKTCRRLTLCLLAATAAAVLAICLQPTHTMDLLTIQGRLHLSLRSDALAKLFMALAAFIWIPVAAFAGPYLKHEKRQQQFLGFYTMALGTLMGLALAQNFVTLYMFFELMTLLTMPLVLQNSSLASRQAGFKYLGYSVFGAGIALAGYFFIAYYLALPNFIAGGALDMVQAMKHRPMLLIVYFLMVVGFGAKAGLLPMQEWLPTAHPEAPAPASAVLSGVITKAGVLAIIRVTYYMFGPIFLRNSWPQYALLSLSLLTILVGSLLAYREKRLKKRLAYSTISQVSYVLFGLLLLSPEGLLGALAQMVFHALAKNALFLSAGAIIYTTGCTRVDELRGIGNRMPLTMGCFTAAALSLIGIPPLAGFISKWYLGSASLNSSLPFFGSAGLVVLLVSALLTAGYLLPIVTNGYFPGKGYLAGRKEAGRGMLWPILLLCGACVLLGLLPNGLIRNLQSIVDQLIHG